MGDHPLNLERESAMIQHLLTLWDATAPSQAAILHTGSAHCTRIGERLRDRGVNFIHLSIPASNLSWYLELGEVSPNTE
jgi:hypothetical protein